MLNYMNKKFKSLVLVGLCLTSAISCFAQTRSGRDPGTYRPVSGEVYLGAGTPLSKVGAQKNYLLRPMAGFEVRYTCPDRPWDVGFGSKAGLIKRFYSEGAPIYVSSEHYLAIDYNVRISPSFVCFSGIEGGVSIAYDMSSYNDYATYQGYILGRRVDTSDYYVPKTVSPYIAARVGFEAWNHLRLTLSCEVCDKGNSNVSFRLGFVF